MKILNLKKIPIELKVYFTFFIVGIVVFSIWSVWNYSLILGWFFSLISLSISFVIKFLFYKNLVLLVKEKNAISQKKKINFLLFLLLSVLTLLLQAGVLLVIIYINKYFNVSSKRIDLILCPINLITYLIGISLICPSILGTLLWNKRKEKKHDICRKIMK